MPESKNNHIADDTELVRLARLAVKQELDRKNALNQPIAVFDPKTKQVFMVRSDGTRELVSDCSKEGRFSERKKT